MTDRETVRSYLLGEIEALEPFGFVVVGPPGKPFEIVEVARREDGALEVCVPGRPPMLQELAAPVRTALAERGFTSEDPEDASRPWIHPAADTEAAVDLVQSLLVDVFEEKPDVALDIAHGSHRAEHEARQKLARVRGQVEKALREMVGQAPAQDADGDFVIPVGDVHVWVAPRAYPTSAVVVRVFAITNVDVTVGPELGLLLARLNFSLMFGRFALDAEHRSIWVDETLLGEYLADEELRFTVGMVASIADEWDDRLKQLFGGATYQDVLAKRTPHEAPPTKPGAGGYL